MNLSRTSTALEPCTWTHCVGNLDESSHQIYHKQLSFLLTCLCFFRTICRAASSALRSARASLSLQTPSATSSLAEASFVLLFLFFFCIFLSLLLTVFLLPFLLPCWCLAPASQPLTFMGTLLVKFFFFTSNTVWRQMYAVACCQVGL